MKHLTQIVREHLTEPNSKVKSKDLVSDVMFKTYHSVFGFFSKINIKSQKIPGGQRLGCERDELSPGKLNNHRC